MHADLAILGSGSANDIPRDLDGARIVMVEGAAPFGGTCLNHGCIPSKMLVYPADLAGSVEHAERLGVDLGLQGVRWPDIRDRIFTQRIDKIAQGGHDYRAGVPGTTLLDGWARFTGPRELAVDLHAGGSEKVTADRVLIGTGSRAVYPGIRGLDALRSAAPELVHTNETIMRVAEQPSRILIVGGGFIGCEFAHVFSGFGSAVTQVVRSGGVLRPEDADVSARMTELAGHQWDLRLRTTVASVELTALGTVLARLHGDRGEESLEVDAILVATGRVPNSDRLDLATAGVDVRADGRIAVDEYQRTSADGVFAMGDVSSPYMLKHVANHEAHTAFHNLAHPDDLVASDHRFVPHAVFTHPQIAAVGLTEMEARSTYGDAVTVKVQDFGDVAYGWAMEDTSSFCKLVADRGSHRLLGAHIIGPQASTLIQPLIQALHFDVPVDRLARGQYWIHPALPEVLENALLGLDLAAPH